MGGDDFFRTRMGQRFYEATMPKIADQLERLNTNVEALVAELRTRREARNDDPNASSAVGRHGPTAQPTLQKIDP